jgi:hypothetical protein
VGKVKCITIAGLDIFFNSNDHLPPHFHINKVGEWEIRVNVLGTRKNGLKFEVVYGHGPSGRIQKTIASLVAANKKRLLKEFEKKVCVKD